MEAQERRMLGKLNPDFPKNKLIKRIYCCSRCWLNLQKTRRNSKSLEDVKETDFLMLKFLTFYNLLCNYNDFFFALIKSHADLDKNQPT